MSLRHALLAILTVEPMTGYELVKYFDGSIAFFWSAPHSQIYPELRRMESGGLLEAEVVPRGERAEKRVYSITEEGRDELRRWAEELTPYHAGRDPHRLKAALFEWASLASARRQLREHIHHHERALAKWEKMLSDIDTLRVPLLSRRLSHRPATEHPAIVAVKRFAFSGEVARARTEIAWAEEGLALLDEFERNGQQLYGDLPTPPPGEPTSARDTGPGDALPEHAPRTGDGTSARRNGARVPEAVRDTRG
ncbi:PadR family transcriptional regulator [Wenjunlia vitaminophila]|uniref:PadR family transcriptional regulator n=1 Tax=Wenjunlia vitaminophila TaxID=76728 RepID=UPI000378EEA3|nr:helix-turn-helix transcriptional regulator [Wenjunlia vitaminophila]